MIVIQVASFENYSEGVQPYLGCCGCTFRYCSAPKLIELLKV
uniref:Uncharacterized protein n=1 Tax=Anguilla anguilla TaxID=7936 RepID=A0A0E9UNR8_ANGAN